MHIPILKPSSTHVRNKKKKTVGSASFGESQEPINQDLNENQPIEFINLFQNDQQPQNQSLDLLHKKFEKLAEIIIEEPSIENLKQFRSALQNILEAILRHSHDLQKFHKKDRYGNPMMEFEIVEIRQGMENLSRQILSHNKDALQIYKQVEEIRGMLISILR